MNLRTWPRLIAILVCVLLSVNSSAFAAKKSREKKPSNTNSAPVMPSETADEPNTAGVIKSIEVVGNKKIEKEAILEKLSNKVGNTLSRDKVRTDIAGLHKTNFFDSVQVDFEADVLKVSVKERPSIAKIVFFGNDQISTDDLKAALTVKTFDLFDENQVRESARKLTKVYEDKGYFLAKVTHEMRYSKDKEMVELLFNIREYDKVRIKKISFLGNQAFNDNQLKRIMRGTAEGGFFSWLTSK